MNTSNNKPEQFSFDFRKLTFTSTNPGKETRIQLIILAVFVLLVVIAFLITIYVMNLNPLTFGVFSGVAGLAGIAGRWRGRSP